MTEETIEPRGSVARVAPTLPRAVRRIVWGNAEKGRAGGGTIFDCGSSVFLFEDFSADILPDALVHFLTTIAPGKMIAAAIPLPDHLHYRFLSMIVLTIPLPEPRPS